MSGESCSFVQKESNQQRQKFVSVRAYKIALHAHKTINHIESKLQISQRMNASHHPNVLCSFWDASSVPENTDSIFSFLNGDSVLKMCDRTGLCWFAAKAIAEQFTEYIENRTVLSYKSQSGQNNSNPDLVDQFFCFQAAKTPPSTHLKEIAVSAGYTSTKARFQKGDRQHLRWSSEESSLLKGLGSAATNRYHAMFVRPTIKAREIRFYGQMTKPCQEATGACCTDRVFTFRHLRFLRRFARIAGWFRCDSPCSTEMQLPCSWPSDRISCQTGSFVTWETLAITASHVTLVDSETCVTSVPRDNPTEVPFMVLCKMFFCPKSLESDTQNFIWTPSETLHTSEGNSNETLRATDRWIRRRALDRWIRRRALDRWIRMHGQMASCTRSLGQNSGDWKSVTLTKQAYETNEWSTHTKMANKPMGRKPWKRCRVGIRNCKQRSCSCFRRIQVTVRRWGK